MFKTLNYLTTLKSGNNAMHDYDIFFKNNQERLVRIKK